MGVEILIYSTEVFLIYEELSRVRYHHHPASSGIQIVLVFVAPFSFSFSYVPVMSSQFDFWLTFQQNYKKELT
jgi:hypothetical protein